MINNKKINYCYIIFFLALHIFLSLNMLELTMKGEFLMNKFQLLSQIILETNYFLFIYVFYVLFSIEFSSLKNNLYILCLAIILLICPLCYMLILSTNKGSLYSLIIVMLIQLFFIYYFNKKIKIVYKVNKILAITAALSIILLFLFIFIKHSNEIIKNKCLITTDKNQMEKCLYWLDSSQYRNGVEYFPNGLIAVELINKNINFKNFLEDKYKSKAIIEGNTIYWDSEEYEKTKKN